MPDAFDPKAGGCDQGFTSETEFSPSHKQTRAVSEHTLAIMKYCKYDLNCRTERILLWRRWGRLQTLTSSNCDQVKRNKCVCNNTTYTISYLIFYSSMHCWFVISHRYLYYLHPQCIIVLHPTIQINWMWHHINLILLCFVLVLLYAWLIYIP